MTNLRSKIRGSVEVDVAQIYSELGGVPHLESITARVDAVLAPLRSELIEKASELFGDYEQDAAAKRAKAEAKA